MKQAPATTHAGRPAPLLLVEDTQSLQVLYRSVLARAGHEVASATTASDALRLFAQSEMNIVLLDLVLPDRDGLSLMKDMLDLRPDTAVIVMTAHGSVGRAVEAMRAGAHEFLVKPFDEARLLSAVANVPGGPVANTPIATAQRRVRRDQADDLDAANARAARQRARIAKLSQSLDDY
jgi:DNA-binding NtrC family response regulator